MGFAKGLNNVTVLIKCMSYETTRQRDRQDVTSRSFLISVMVSDRIEAVKWR